MMGLFREEQYIQSFRSFRLPGNPSIHGHDLAVELCLPRGIALVGSVSSSNWGVTPPRVINILHQQFEDGGGCAAADEGSSILSCADSLPFQRKVTGGWARVEWRKEEGIV